MKHNQVYPQDTPTHRSIVKYNKLLESQSSWTKPLFNTPESSDKINIFCGGDFLWVAVHTLQTLS